MFATDTTFAFTVVIYTLIITSRLTSQGVNFLRLFSFDSSASDSEDAHNRDFRSVLPSVRGDR